MCSDQTAYFGVFAVQFEVQKFAWCCFRVKHVIGQHPRQMVHCFCFVSVLFSLLQATQILLESCDTDNFDLAHIPPWVRRLFVIDILIKSDCIYIHILSVSESFRVSHDFKICSIICFHPSATDPQLAKANSFLDMWLMLSLVPVHVSAILMRHSWLLRNSIVRIFDCHNKW